MQMSETCPKCGSILHSVVSGTNHFACDATYLASGEFIASTKCRNIQITRLTAELASVKAERDALAAKLEEYNRQQSAKVPFHKQPNLESNLRRDRDTCGNPDCDQCN